MGFTEDINNRLKRHNGGRVKSTKFYKPWELLGFEQYKTKEEALKMEKFFKAHQQKEILKKKYMAR